MMTLEPLGFNEAQHFVKGLYVKETGPRDPTRLRTPIVLVHGACHGWWAFHKWLSFFAVAGWKTYALSLRNHPGSYSVPASAFLRLRLDDYVDDVLEVLAWLERPAILIGHSMGGIILQKVAEKSRPSVLVLVASVGPGQLGAIRDPLPVDTPVMFSFQEAREIWFHRIEDQTYQTIYPLFVPESPSVMNHYSSGKVRIDRSKVRCPTLVIGPEHERTVVHGFEKIAAFYGADRLYVPDAGHDLFLEAAALDVAIRINHWLLSVLPHEGLPLAGR
ncbi:MAG: alpha/beta hydrolase [Desulfobacterales bacterium]|nr:MAG: alpha/beta hydrolase [Desulfobacterales bacterium]